MARVAETTEVTPSALGMSRLDVFVGRWNIEGQQHQGLVGPAARIRALETYEWLTGNLFLVHRFDGRVGDEEAACIEIIGLDADNQRYLLRTYYNTGLTNDWELREQSSVWTLTGRWIMQGYSMLVRSVMEFGDGGRSRTARWEYSRDGSSWQTFWTINATKVASVSSSGH